MDENAERVRELSDAELEQIQKAAEEAAAKVFEQVLLLLLAKAILGQEEWNTK